MVDGPFLSWWGQGRMADCDALPDRASKTSRQIAREVVREACQIDELLLKFVGASRRRHCEVGRSRQLLMLPPRRRGDGAVQLKAVL